MVADPPTRLITNGHSSGNTLAKTKSERKGERFRSLVRPITKAVKDKPYRNVRKVIHRSAELTAKPAGGGCLPVDAE